MFSLGRDLPASAFADVARVKAHLSAYLFETSGSASAWDTFLHCTVPSLQLQRLLLQLYRPFYHRFANYTRSWKPRIDAICGSRCQERNGHVEVSRYLSAAAALNLVQKAEESDGKRYRAIYLTRFDVLLWASVDLRRYCVGPEQGEVVYTGHCHPPFVTSHGPAGAPADFHFVLSSRHARGFASITQHFARFDFFLEWEEGRRYQAMNLPDRKNRLMTQFLQQVVGVRSVMHDHVVCARHESNLRKLRVGDPHNYARCCKTDERQGNCRHLPLRLPQPEQQLA